MSEETIERTFEISSPVRLSVSNIRGSVEVRPGQDDRVKVLAVKHTDTGDAERTHIEIEQKEDGSVEIRTRYDLHDHHFCNSTRPCRVEYTVEAPAECSLRLNTVSSSADVSGLKGNVKVDSVSGSVTLHDLAGHLELDVVSASASLQRINGPLVIQAVSGDVRLAEADSDSIQASTVSGNLDLEIPLRKGPYTMRSVSGTIHLTVPGETGCRVIMSTISGHIRTDMPMTVFSRKFGHQYAEIQGGGVAVHVDTVSGDFILGHTGEIKTPSKIHQSAQERCEVLERISTGEITVEEALNQLK